MRLAQKVLAALAFTGAAVCGVLNGLYLLQLIDRPGPLLSGLFLGVLVLGALAIFACLQLAKEGIRGRTQQWKYIYANTPSWFRIGTLVIAAYAILWAAFDVVRRHGDLGRSWEDAPMGVLTATMMFSYVVIGGTFVGTQLARTPRRVV